MVTKLATFLLLALSAPALACSCMEEGPIEEDFAESNAVLLVRIEAREARDLRHDDDSAEPTDYLYRARILRSFKGEAGRSISVRTALNDAACGVNLRIGKRYLLWTFRAEGDHSGIPFVSLCSRTKEAARAKQDLAWLEKKKRQSP